MGERVLALMGPTASGKTALAEQLAERYDAELISVDSALVYRGLSIGAAKPDYPHHLIHIRDPDDPYTAADFARDAKQCIDEIRARGRRPILVGGSMLYFRALIQGFDEIPAIDSAIRADIEAEAQRSGWPALHQQLNEVDPETAGRLHPNHSQRICRALEVYRGTGTPLSDWQRGNLDSASDDYECISLCPEDRASLHARIVSRLDAMFEQGLVAEVTRLYEQESLHSDLPAIRAVGYRQVWAYLDGKSGLDECREKALFATRQLAKRQLTWLRGWPDLAWIWTDAEGCILPRADSVAAPRDLSNHERSGSVVGVWHARIQEVMRNF